MASISRPELLPVKQFLFPLIRGIPSTIVLEYLGEKAHKTLHSARKMLKLLLNVDIKCEEPVSLVRDFKSLQNLFKPSENPFPIVCKSKDKSYKISQVQKHKADGDLINARIVSQRANAIFSFDYNPKAESCLISARYRGDLPVWIKVGNPECWLSPEKGIPTAKVMTKLLMDELGMTKENVKTLTSHSMNPQTVVDVVHALLVQGKPMQEAFALAHTSQLNAELVQNLEAYGLRLVSIKRAYSDSFCDADYLLENSDLSETQKDLFKKQPKVREIYELTGIDLFQNNTCLPRELQVCVPDLITLTYRVTMNGPRRAKAATLASCDV